MPRSPGFHELPPTQVQAPSEAEQVEQGFTERRCRLVVVSGPQAGRTVDVARFPFVVGKGEECDLVLADPTVSRTHFVIEQQQGAFVIRDEGSTNGTWFEQVRIREAWLRPGALVRAGQVQLRFESVFKPLDVAPSSADRFGSLVGRSVRMRQIFALLERVAQTDATVVMFGETGTGKSAVAQAIHEASPRRFGPFITVDCGAIADNLIESELFGHEKGAFTGAQAMRRGALERAHGGTLFIDELVDLRMDLQPRLLRVLEEREVRRVGGNDAIKLDVRIIAASRFDLWREVQDKRFREDLYFRLAVFTIPLPSLRERKEDIPLLASSFLRTLKGGDRVAPRFGPDVMQRLSAHPFPGNVRELRNIIERAITLDATPDELLAPMAGLEPPASLAAVASSSSPAAAPAPDADAAIARALQVDANAVASAVASADTSSRVSLAADCSLPFKEAKEKLLEEFEAVYFKRLLTRESGNASAIARAAGIDRKHLYTLAKKHGLDWKGKPEG